MNERQLSTGDIERMTTPTWEQAKAAIRDGNGDWACELIDRAVGQWHGLQEYSINWITSLLSFVAEEMGEEAVERALRKTGDEFVRPRRDTGVDWGSLPASKRAKVITRAMVANFGSCTVEEDDEKIALSFRCGSGGKLIDDGKYTGPNAYAVLREPAGRTFMRDELPVYCAHCPVNNEMQPLEWGSVPTSVEYPPTAPGEPCVHHIYKDTSALPDEVYVRLGRTPPVRP